MLPALIAAAAASEEARKDIAGPIGQWVAITAGLLLILGGLYKFHTWLGRIEAKVDRTDTKVEHTASKVEERTETIQPGANSGHALGDAIRGIARLERTLQAHIRQTDGQRQEWLDWRASVQAHMNKVEEKMDGDQG